MSAPKVSIIVGCYNVAKWLIEGRLNYIYNQTYEDWELILVDDGSTDDTGKILEDEARKDERIIVIHKENGGLGSARNAGLEIAQGKYIWSFDVDDEVDADLLERVCFVADETNAEVLCFGYVEHNNELKIQTECQFDRISCHSNDEVRAIYLDHILLKFNNGFFWNKLYRRDFLEKNQLRFGNERIQQDEVFNLKVYKCVNHLELIPGALYHYYVYNTGNNRSRFISNRYQIYKSVYAHFCELRDCWKLNDERFEKYLFNRLFDSLNVLLRYNLSHPNCPWSREECEEEMNRVLNDKDYSAAIMYKERKGVTLEKRLFLFAYRKHSLRLIKLLNGAFSGLRNFKRKIICKS